MATLGNGNGTRLGPVNLQRLAAALTAKVERCGGRKVNGEWEFPCPAPGHDDEHPSANWNPDKSGGVWCCRSMSCEKQHGGGTAIVLAEMFGLDVDSYREPSRSTPSAAPAYITAFAKERDLDPVLLVEVWGLRAVGGKRPALRYPTDLGVDRLKFRDCNKPKYMWAAKGKGRTHWYGLKQAMALLGATDTGPAILYIVNGEPAVWAAYQRGIPAVCFASGEKASRASAGLAAGLATELEGLGRAIQIRVVFDIDGTGRTGGPDVAAALAKAGLDAMALDLAGSGVALPEGGDVGDLAAAVGDELGAVLAGLPAMVDSTRRPAQSDVHAGADDNADGGAVRTDKRSLATKMVDLVLESDAELFHAPDQEQFVDVMNDGQRLTLKLASRQFGQWLRKAFYDSTGKAVGAAALADATGTLQAKAAYEGPEHRVDVRMAQIEGRLYVDLGGSDGRAVEIDSDRWRVVERPSVRFWRPSGLLPLPEPLPGGNVNELWDFLKVSERDRPLVLGWIVFAIRPTGPFPVLIFSGEQGSGKSTASRVLRALIDPNKASIRAEPHEPRDLVIAAANGWCMAFDNLSGVNPTLSDALCRLATGGGYAKRTNYTDTDETIFDVQRPVILNGISELATRSDLVDRAVLIYLPRIAETERETEARFWDRFEERRPYILGALLDAVCTALQRQAAVRLPKRPRMADFAEFVTAAEPGLGLVDGAFLAAYDGNRMVAHEVALDGSPVAQELLKLLDGLGPAGFVGEPAALLSALGALRSDHRVMQGWPNTPRGLTGILARLAPNFRALGIDVITGADAGRGHGGARRIIVRRVRQSTVTTVTTVTTATPKPLQPELGLGVPQPVDDNRHPDDIDRHQPSPSERGVALNGDHGGGGDGTDPVPDLAWVPPDAHLGASGDLEAALP